MARFVLFLVCFLHLLETAICGDCGDRLRWHMREASTLRLPLFEGFRIQEDEDGCQMYPEGRRKDFLLRLAVEPQVEADEVVEQLEKLLAPLGLKKREAAGSVLEFESKPDVIARIRLLTKRGFLIAIMAIGTSKAQSEFGCALEVVAENTEVLDRPCDDALLGTWHYEGGSQVGAPVHVQYAISITILPDGTFREERASGGGGAETGYAFHRNEAFGSVRRLGDRLVFRYADGTVWTARYSWSGDVLLLDGRPFRRD